ncbi:MAG: methylase involved in ubiquinone/menaquinone biosynthesis [Gemmatimonadetes bacterium]|nr:methylase involved in ubiquinone/menaquinone biosynthesis [Gemmatimonadota bacterium]
MSGSYALPPFVCPSCYGALAHLEREGDEQYTCESCSRAYPVVIGIPDFRLRPDPWIGLEEDRAKGMALENETRNADFESTVRAYWAMTPDTPRHLAERFTQFVVTAEPRASEWLDSTQRAALPRGPWLDVGCGTADLVVAALRRGQPTVGIDIAFRWLVVARRRLASAGLDAPLVCCNAEHLPFAPGSFAHVVSLGTMEHCLDAAALVAEAHRVLARDGAVSLRTVNRYSPLPEPHVGVWGVGYVPRRWADAYVRWRSGQGYEHHQPLSPREIRRELRAAGFHRVRVTPATLLPSDRQRVGRMAAVVPLYDGLRRMPMIDRLMCWVAPLLEASGVAA